MGKSKIEIILGSITNQRFGAIVNAANEGLCQGGGVCGAIFDAAGRNLNCECEKLRGCKTGQAKITQSYNLEKQGVGWIIHAVGPVWEGGSQNEEKLLYDAYSKSLKLAADYKKNYLNQYIEINGIKELEDNKFNVEMLEKIKNYISKHPIKSIAFPSISTGIYKFPLDKATPIAINAIRDFLKSNDKIERVAMVLRNNETYKAYLNELNNIQEGD